MSTILYRNILNTNAKRFGKFLSEINNQYNAKCIYIFDAKKDSFFSELPKSQYIIICSHGTEESIYHRMADNSQRDNQYLLDLHNSCYLKGKIVIAFSCSTAKTLGPKAIENGCISYLGFKRKIHFETKDHCRPSMFYTLLRQCYITSFKETLEYAFTNDLTMQQFKLRLSHNLNNEAQTIAAKYQSINAYMYNKHRVSEIITTVANVASTLEISGSSTCILHF